MKLSTGRIKSLQPMLKQVAGREYTDSQTQEAGMAIIRFVIAKAQRKQESLKLKENGNGKSGQRTADIN